MVNPLPPKKNYPVLVEETWLLRECTVWDVTWISDQFVHLAKWLPALAQVTAKCIKFTIFFGAALGQVAHSGTQLSDSPY